jgi:hypothetical protein
MRDADTENIAHRATPWHAAPIAAFGLFYQKTTSSAAPHRIVASLFDRPLIWDAAALAAALREWAG